MSRSITIQTPTGAPAVIAAPADGSDNLNADVSALIAEVEALRLRLAALEQRSPAAAPEQLPGRQARPRPSRKTVAWLTTGAALAMLAGASVVYGETDAFFISKEGDVAIGPHGGLFVGKAGNVGIGTDTPSPDSKLQVKGKIAAESLIVDNVGIGTQTPSPDNKLEVKGKIAAQSLNAAIDARSPVFATLDQSVKIEGSGGRNMFSDNEKAGDLRVGAAWGTPGIYSEKGDVVVGSVSNNVWLYGKVAISKQGDAQKRNQPETLYVDGGIKSTGTVVGNIKTRFQVNNNPELTLSKPNWRYLMTLTGGGRASRTQTIPTEVLIALCGPPDGCTAVLGRRLWSPNETTSWSNTFHFIYDSNALRFTADAPFNRDGFTIKGQNLNYVANAGSRGGDYCFLTPETWENNQNKGNLGNGLQLRIDGGDRPERECTLTLIP